MPPDPLSYTNPVAYTRGPGAKGCDIKSTSKILSAKMDFMTEPLGLDELPNPPKTYSVKEAASILKKPLHFVYNVISKGELHAENTEPGKGVICVTQAELDRFKAAQIATDTPVPPTNTVPPDEQTWTPVEISRLLGMPPYWASEYITLGMAKTVLVDGKPKLTRFEIDRLIQSYYMFLPTGERRKWKPRRHISFNPKVWPPAEAQSPACREYPVSRLAQFYGRDGKWAYKLIQKGVLRAYKNDAKILVIDQQEFDRLNATYGPVVYHRPAPPAVQSVDVPHVPTDVPVKKRARKKAVKTQAEVIAPADPPALETEPEPRLSQEVKQSLSKRLLDFVWF